MTCSVRRTSEYVRGRPCTKQRNLERCSAKSADDYEVVVDPCARLVLGRFRCRTRARRPKRQAFVHCHNTPPLPAVLDRSTPPPLSPLPCSRPPPKRRAGQPPRPLRPADTKESGAAALYAPDCDSIDTGGACASWARARWRLQGAKAAGVRPCRARGRDSARSTAARSKRGGVCVAVCASNIATIGDAACPRD